MDETTFQGELRELKQRITEIANSSPPTPSEAQLSGFMLANTVRNDLFTAQLRDVRTRLDIMQTSLLQQGRGQATEARQPQRVVTDFGAKAFEDLNLNVHVLHNTINRCNRETNSRISSLEQAITRLQGAIAFTPNCSETTIEDITAAREAYPIDDTEESEPKSPTSVHDVFTHQNEQDKPATLSQVHEESWTDHDAIPPPFMAICPPKLDHHPEPLNLPEILDASATLGNTDYTHHEPVREHLDSTPTITEDPQDDLSSTHVQISQQNAFRDEELARLDEIIWQQRSDFAARLSTKDAVISHLNTLRTAAEEASQITRTDLEDRLVESQNQLARWRNEAKNAQEGFEAMARCNRELQDARDHAIGRLRHDLKQCEASRHHFMTKYVDENYRFKWLEQRKLQSEQRLYGQLDECERALESSERNRDEDIRNALQSRDEDVEQLYAFCQEKTTLVTHQEEIIAQGTSILHERDAEIDRLNGALAESQRGRLSVREHASRYKRSIQIREDEIEDLRRELRKERDRRCRLEEMMRRDADAAKVKSKDVRFSASPIARSRKREGWIQGRGARDDEKVDEQPSIPFGPGMPMMPHRQQESLAALPLNPATLLYAAGETQKEHPATESSHRERNRPEAQFANQQSRADSSSSRVIGNGRSSHWHSGMEAQAAANSGPAENRRHALPLDATWLPPLPARASASAAVEKVSSVPNLRAGRHSHPVRGQGAISKPASMLELRPQRYQAPSVETEAESAGDQGGSSLLDY